MDSITLPGHPVTSLTCLRPQAERGNYRSDD